MFTAAHMLQHTSLHLSAHPSVSNYLTYTLLCILMPYKTLSEHVKNQKQSRLKEMQILQAVEDYRAELSKPDQQKGAHAIAKEHGMEKSYKTIINRYNNGRSVQKAHEDQQKLTVAEEAVLIDFFQQSADRGFPQLHHNITQYGNLICKSRLGEDCEKLGDTWVTHFLDQHCDVLQMHWSWSLNTQQAQPMNPEAKKRWFELLQEFVVEVGI